MSNRDTGGGAMTHECEWLYWCLDHPRWHVTGRIDGMTWAWIAWSPRLGEYADFPTFAEAITYAQRMAQEDQP